MITNFIYILIMINILVYNAIKYDKNLMTYIHSTDIYMRVYFYLTCLQPG